MNLRTLRGVNQAIVVCTRCPRLRTHCRNVALEKKREFRQWDYWGKPVPGLGDAGARLLIVGLAPAAHGANRTGRMFTGDSSGTWLYEALHRFGFASRPDALSAGDGLELRDCYITAAARCAPPANKLTRDELDQCQPFLAAELQLLNHVRVVVTLGRVAHEAWLRCAGWWAGLAPAARPSFGHGIVTPMPDGITLISSYHHSRQNTNTGKLNARMMDTVFSQARRALQTG